MCPNFRGRSAFPVLAMCWQSARKSKPSSSASTRKNRRFLSASASSKPIHGTRSSISYTIGKQVEGKVRNTTAYGAFVELEEGHRRHDPRLRHELDPQDQPP